MSVLDRLRDEVLALFLIVVGSLFACHGAAALFGVLGVRQVEAFAWPGWWASAIQVVGGALVMVGFGTRPAALFSFAFLVIAAVGNGAWAVESRLSARKRELAAAAD